MSARETVLAAVRSGQSRVPKPASVAAEVSRPAPAGLAQVFAEEARRSDAEVWVEEDREGVLARVRELIQGQDVLAWDLGSLNAAVAPAAKSLSLAVDPAQGRGHLSVGLTACQRAIADTGSLVLAAGPGCPREASLVVRTHVALVDPADLVPDLGAALAFVAGLGEKAAHVNIITGPSRTADIEMTLTRGVHGPKRLLIVLGPWREAL